MPGVVARGANLQLVTHNIQYATPHGARPGGEPAHRADAASAELLAEHLAQLSPDVLALQEVDRAKLRSGGADQLAIIAKRTGLTPLFGQTKFRYGNALLTRYPIVRARMLHLPGRSAPWVDLSQTGSHSRFKWPDPRIALFALLDAPVGEVCVGVTHLSTVRPMARMQLRVALEGFARFAPGRPAILLGDLNLRLEMVEEELSGTPFQVAARGLTVPSWGPTIQIDHIITAGLELPAAESSVHPFPVSDHAALAARIG